MHDFARQSPPANESTKVKQYESTAEITPTVGFRFLEFAAKNSKEER